MEIQTEKIFDLTKFDDEFMFSPLQIDLMSLLRKNGPMTRKDLVKNSNSPRTTVYDNLMRLLNHKLIKKFPRPTNSRGRPFVFYKITGGN